MWTTCLRRLAKRKGEGKMSERGFFGHRFGNIFSIIIIVLLIAVFFDD